MHIYVFGSLCRGEVSYGSDVDVLALVDGRDERFDPDLFSIYSYERMSDLWQQGNPFAWHLALESKLVFASDGTDYLGALGEPAPYGDCARDCEKFRLLFREARQSLERDSLATVFDLSTIFLSVRNIATCYSLGMTEHPDFARHSVRHLPPEDRLLLSVAAYDIIERARILTTRGVGEAIGPADTEQVVSELDIVSKWMDRLVERAVAHGRS